MSSWKVVSVFSILFTLTLFLFHLASADVWIPNDELGAYYDSNGTYTVVGAVKNSEDKAIVPTIDINVKVGDRTISKSYTLSIVNPSKDIPFKIKLVAVQDKNAILEKPEVTFVTTDHGSMNVVVNRDNSKYYFTYLSTGYVTDAKFDNFQQTLSLTARNPFPDTAFVNFMFPQESQAQKFSVASNGVPIDFLQSKDPDGNWHVAFNLPAKSTSYVSIAGFEQHPLLPVGNYRNYLLIIIPVAAAVISIIIWKKKTN